MVTLTIKRIGQLSNRADVKGMAVENFLGCLDGLTMSEALFNLDLDARLYKWNSATCRAIRTGILEHFMR